MEIKDRLKMVMDSHGLTAGSFADKIGVQRSNVSHVLSGRNKPGFDFIEKLLVAFPRVSAQWLLTGVHPASEPFEKDEVVVGEKQVVEVNQQKGLSSKKLVKLMMFYDDHTFETYYPNEQ